VVLLEPAAQRVMVETAARVEAAAQQVTAEPLVTVDQAAKAAVGVAEQAVRVE
jgi:hypothetical protein